MHVNKENNSIEAKVNDAAYIVDSIREWFITADEKRAGYLSLFSDTCKSLLAAHTLLVLTMVLRVPIVASKVSIMYFLCCLKMCYDVDRKKLLNLFEPN